MGHDGSLPHPSAREDHLQGWKHGWNWISEPRGDFTSYCTLILTETTSVCCKTSFWKNTNSENFFYLLLIYKLSCLLITGFHSESTLERSWRHAEAVRYMFEWVTAALQHLWSRNLFWHLGVDQRALSTKVGEHFRSVCLIYGGL